MIPNIFDINSIGASILSLKTEFVGAQYLLVSFIGIANKIQVRMISVLDFKTKLCCICEGTEAGLLSPLGEIPFGDSGT